MHRDGVGLITKTERRFCGDSRWRGQESRSLDFALRLMKLIAMLGSGCQVVLIGMKRTALRFYAFEGLVGFAVFVGEVESGVVLFGGAFAVALALQPLA